MDGDSVMLSTEEQKRICTQYSKRDKEGIVHCKDCPLVISISALMCHANSHYDPDLCDFVMDEHREDDGENK